MTAQVRPAVRAVRRSAGHGAVILLLAAALDSPALPAFAQDALKLAGWVARSGPFAPAAMPLANGQRDYIRMINQRDGGVNGLLLELDECEVGASLETGADCYEKAKADGRLLVLPLSTDIAIEVLPRAAADRIVLLSPGYGPAAAADGRTFRWAFGPPASAWDATAMLLGAASGGDPERLRGRTVALLYLDVPEGREPLTLLQWLADRHGFGLRPVPVALREIQNQTAQWQVLAEEQPDIVLLSGRGAMNVAALAEAAKADFPMERIFGLWSAGQEDLAAVGKAGKGYQALSWNLPVADAAVIRDIRAYVLDRGLSQAGAVETASLSYQRGVLGAAFAVEAIRAAQERFDTRAIDGEQLRWGLENLKLDEAALAGLGVVGMIAPFALSCTDHAGHAGVWLLEWDGARLRSTAGPLEPDREALLPLVRAEAEAFAAANSPWPVTPACAP